MGARGQRQLAAGLALAAGLVWFDTAVGAAPLVRGRFTTSEAEFWAGAWEARGIDVVEGSVTPRTLEVVAPRDVLEGLRDKGLRDEGLRDPSMALDMLETGGPRAEGARRLAADERADEPARVPPTYETYQDITAHMATLCARRPGVCQVVDLTATYGAPPTFEGRHIHGVKLSDNVALDEDEPAVLIVAAHHAREINTPVVALTALAHLIDGYGSDTQVTAAVDANQIWIVPVWNPDGYDYVFSTDNLWRKNRRVFDEAVGVDLNRNYPFGWDAACSSGGMPADDTYKGPTAASEAETQTMLLLAGQQRFAKVLDFHSAGREVVAGYPCESDARASFRMAEAGILAKHAGYGGTGRLPASQGQHEQFESAALGAHAFLIEVGEQFQPDFADSVAEAEQVWPAIAWMLQRPISVGGHVSDACTGAPLVAGVEITNLPYASGESDSSGEAFGRFHVFLPAGGHTLRFTAPGYRPDVVDVAVSDDASVALEIALRPVVPCGGERPGARAVAPRRSGVRGGAEGGCAYVASTPRGWLVLIVGAGLVMLRGRRSRVLGASPLPLAGEADEPKARRERADIPQRLDASWRGEQPERARVPGGFSRWRPPRPPRPARAPALPTPRPACRCAVPAPLARRPGR